MKRNVAVLASLSVGVLWENDMGGCSNGRDVCSIDGDGGPEGMEH